MRTRPFGWTSVEVPVLGQGTWMIESTPAASVAALTVYDMAKAIDKEMVIAEVVLVEKTKDPA